MASAAAPSTSSSTDYKTEREVVDAYTRFRQELSQLADRVQDLEAQLAEHALVAKTMRPMDKGRKAYRLVRVFDEGDFFFDRTKASDPLSFTFFSFPLIFFFFFVNRSATSSSRGLWGRCSRQWSRTWRRSRR